VTLKRIVYPLMIIMFGLMVACSAKHTTRTEFDFANKLAQEGLWKEAHFRWSQLVEQGKESASLYNNLAIALEEMGQLEEAEKMYQKALKLSPNHPTIQSNYEKLKKLSEPEKEKDNQDEKEEKSKKNIM